MVVTEAFAPDKAWSSVSNRANFGVLKCSNGSAGSTGFVARLSHGRAKALQEATSVAVANKKCMMRNGEMQMK